MFALWFSLCCFDSSQFTFSSSTFLFYESFRVLSSSQFLLFLLFFYCLCESVSILSSWFFILSFVRFVLFVPVVTLSFRSASQKMSFVFCVKSYIPVQRTEQSPTGCLLCLLGFERAKDRLEWVWLSPASRGASDGRSDS